MIPAPGSEEGPQSLPKLVVVVLTQRAALGLGKDWGPETTPGGTQCCPLVSPRRQGPRLE